MSAHEPISVARAAGAADAAWLAALWQEEWGGTFMVVGGRTHHLRDLEALIAWRGAERVGAATYALEAADAELVSLNALTPRLGVGSALVAAAAAEAAAKGGRRLALATTNDNVGALAFYQRLGLRLVRVELGAVDRVRLEKPSIPLVRDGLMLHDQWRLEVAIDPGPAIPATPIAGRLPERALALVVREGQVATVERCHAGRTWRTLPGATVAPGESAVDAAARACREEIGLAADVRREALAVWVGGRLERVLEAVLPDGVAPAAHAVLWLDVGRAASVHPAAVASLLASDRVDRA